MPYNIYLINSRGVELELVTPYYRFRDIDGIGMPEVQHLEEEYAQQDGATYLGTRLAKRIILMRFDLVLDTEAELWNARKALAQIAKAFESGFKIRMALPNGDVRQLDARYSGQLTMPRNLEQHDRQQTAVMECVCHNPLWYDPTGVLWMFAVSGGDGDYGWEPDGLGWPAGFGASAAVGAQETFRYLGSWKAYPLITLRGPMTEPIITNHITGDVLEFIPGFSLDEGETVEIDLQINSRGQRPLTVIHSVDGEIPDALTDDSDLGSWHIAADPEAVDGNNIISVAFTGGNYLSRVEMRFYNQSEAV